MGVQAHGLDAYLGAQIGFDMSEMDLCQRWGHSFEEDSGDVTVYRPAGYAFPRARGRAGIEFGPDGTFIDWAIGPTDAPRAFRGHWEIDRPSRLRVRFAGDTRAPWMVEILHLDGSLLKVRRIEPSLSPDR